MRAKTGTSARGTPRVPPPDPEGDLLLIDEASEAVVPGDVVCAFGAGFARAIPERLAAAGRWTGIVLTAANPGELARIQKTGAVAASVTGLVGAEGPIVVGPDARALAVDLYQVTDYRLGWANAVDTLTLGERQIANLLRTVHHGGNQAIHAGNNGLGQGRPARNTWSTTVPVAAYPHGYGNTAFRGGVFDGRDVWLVPYSAVDVVRVDPATGAMIGYAHGYGADAFIGGVFDGQNVWLVPYSALDVVKLDPATGGMTGYAHAYGAEAFTGGVFDGENIWLVPDMATDLVKVDPATGGMTSYPHGASAHAFSGGVFDGKNIWLVPFSEPNLVKIDPATGGMTKYPLSAPVGGDYFGGVFDGEELWLIPYNSDYLTRVNPSSGIMVDYAHGYVTPAFGGAAFDGENLWLSPRSSPDVVKVNPETGAMLGYPHGAGINHAFTGAVFDGQSVWLVPNRAADLLRLRPHELGRYAEFTPGPLTVGEHAHVEQYLELENLAGAPGPRATAGHVLVIGGALFYEGALGTVTPLAPP